VSLVRIREQPGGGVEAVRGSARVTLWPGPAPASPPEHPGLAWPIEPGWLHEKGAWLEHRPPGARLAELAGQLSPPELGMVLLDLAEALAALHAGGSHHGQVDLDHVVVSHHGRAILIGVGRESGTAKQDSRDLRMLMAELWPPTAPPPPDPGEEPAAVLAEALSGWLAYEFPDHTAFSLGSRSKDCTPDAAEDAETIPFRPAGAFDEVGPDLGPDRYGRGLLDRWATGNSLSGAHTGAIEFTRPGDEDERVPSAAALLTRLVAPPDRPPDPHRFAAVEGTPCEEIKALVADEPIQPLPLPSSTRRRSLPGLEPEDEPEEPTRPTAIAEEVSETALRVVGALLIAALCAVALVLAWVLGT